MDKTVFVYIYHPQRGYVVENDIGIDFDSSANESDAIQLGDAEGLLLDAAEETGLMPDNFEIHVAYVE